MAFGHESLDVYNLSLDYVAWVMEYSATLKTPDSSLRNQWLRASASIPLNTAEGNGKVTEADRGRFFEIARASSLECSAIQDILAVSNHLDSKLSREKKQWLERIVSMLTKLGGRGYTVQESSGSYGEVDYENDSDFDNDIGSSSALRGDA